MEVMQKPPSPHLLPPHQNEKFSKLTYYYFVIGLSLVVFVLLLTSSIFIRCFSWVRHFLERRKVFGRDRSKEDVMQWIPTFRYINKGAGGEEMGGGGSARSPECVVCISAFGDGEEVRKLPQCGHLFHAVCIDMWLTSHKSCPVCRGGVLPAATSSVSIKISPDIRENIGPPAASVSSVASV